MSANYGEPQWTAPSNSGASNIPDVSPNDFSSTPKADNIGMTPSEAKTERSTMVQSSLSILNVAICGVMIYLGVKGILAVEFSFASISELFVIFYMFVFSALLLAYEAMWWKGIKSINKLLRKNFGFLYGIKGKAVYLVFVAFLCFGLEGIPTLESISWITGIVWLATGVLHIFLSFAKPHLFSDYKPPTAGYDNPV